jgi:hypothetical protein
VRTRAAEAFNYEPWSAYRQYRDRHRDMANSLGFEGRSGCALLIHSLVHCHDAGVPEFGRLRGRPNSTWRPRRVNCTPHRCQLEVRTGEQFFVLSATCLWRFDRSSGYAPRTFLSSLAIQALQSATVQARL